MNAYEIIKSGLENELDDTSIIDELQKCYPNSQIETNIFLIDETRMIMESVSKHITTEMKSNYFLIKKGKEYFDLESGRRFKEYKDKRYSECRHGLCKKLNTLILKNMIKKSHSPSVFKAISEKSKENKSIRIKYQNENKKQQIWEFTSQEINECMKCVDEGKNSRQISIALFCPKECIQKLINYIDINQKVNRNRNGNSNKKERRRRKR